MQNASAKSYKPISELALSRLGMWNRLEME